MTAARMLTSSRSCSRSGSWSRMSAFGQSFIEKLLHSAHRVVIMHTGGSFRSPHRLGDLLVRQTLCHTKGKYLALRGRQSFDRCSQATLRFVGDHRVERVVLRGRIALLNLGSVAASLFRAPPVEQQTTFDREQPGAKGAFTAKSIERIEGAYERVLHQLIDVASLPRADGKPGKGCRVTLHELRRGAFVASLPSRDEVQIPLIIATPASHRVAHSVQQVDVTRSGPLRSNA